MDYKKIVPPQLLQPYVQFFWTMDQPDTTVPSTILNPFADGCPGLMFHESIIPFKNDSKGVLPTVLLHGQTVQPVNIYMAGAFRAIGVCFAPNVIKTLFRIDAHMLTDECIDIDEAFPNAHVSERLLNARSATTRLKILTAFIATLIKNNEAYVEPVTAEVMTAIRHANGKLSLRHLQQSMRLSERSIERRFTQHIGVSPKLFSQITRFQSSLLQLRSGKYETLSDVAFDNGYADQSHFIRSFKYFTGSSPLAFRKVAQPTLDTLSAVIH